MLGIELALHVAVLICVLLCAAPYCCTALRPVLGPSSYMGHSLAGWLAGSLSSRRTPFWAAIDSSTLGQTLQRLVGVAVPRGLGVTHDPGLQHEHPALTGKASQENDKRLHVQIQ